MSEPLILQVTTTCLDIFGLCANFVNVGVMSWGETNLLAYLHFSYSKNNINFEFVIYIYCIMYF